jgi:uncharacterized protein (DUF885 family)
MSKYTDWLSGPIEYAKEIGDHLVYLPVERAVELMVHLAISAGRIEYLEEENDRYCNGYKGGCWACESVGELNIKQRDRIAELEAEEQLFNKTFDAQQAEIEQLRAENQRLREAAQAVVDSATPHYDRWVNGVTRICINRLAALLGGGDGR